MLRMTLYNHGTIEFQLVQCACADESSTVDHTPHCRPRVAAPCNGDTLTPLERQVYHQTMTKSRPSSPLASLEARWPAEQACRNARRRSLELENASLWPLGPGGNLVCAHGTPILTNRESSELVGERIFYALQVRTRTIIIRKLIV